MKQLNVTFEDDEYTELIAAKKEAGLNWRRFVLTLIKKETL